MTEEEYIKLKIGKRNPFSVPEGYFEQLEAEVMKKLPNERKNLTVEKQDKAFIIRLRPLLYVAACTFIAFFGFSIYKNLDKHNNINQQEQIVISQNSQEISDTYIDEAADYAMLDNEDIYASLLADM